MNMNPRKHQARQPRPRLIKSESIESAGGDSHSTTYQILKSSEEAAAARSISSLHPDSIRWINRRKKVNTNSVAGSVLPSKAVQLRELFKSLDEANEGVIKLKSVKNAVKLVSQGVQSLPPPSPSPVSSPKVGASQKPGTPSSKPGSPSKLLDDPKPLLDFFSQMDSNKDGVVDFSDFLAAMTHEPTTDAEKDRIVNPQDEFFDFATKHQRQKIIDYVKDYENSDLQKYEELKKLFQLTYFTTKPIDLTVNDKLNRVKAELKKRMKELHSEQFIQRKRKEVLRAREAALFFDSQQRKFDSTHQGTSANAAGLLSQSVMMEDNDVDKQIRKRFAQFALHNDQTYTPKVSEVPKTRNCTYFQKAAREELYNMKNDKYLLKNIPPILPPISMKDKLAQPGTSQTN